MRAQAARLLSPPRRRTPATTATLDWPAVLTRTWRSGRCSRRAGGHDHRRGSQRCTRRSSAIWLRLSLDATPCSRGHRGAGGACWRIHCWSVTWRSGSRRQLSGRVLGNLFYRGLAARPIYVGDDALRTTHRRWSSGAVPARRGGLRAGICAAACHDLRRAMARVLDYHQGCAAAAGTSGRPRRTRATTSRQRRTHVAERDVRELAPGGGTSSALRREPSPPLFAELQAGRVMWRSRRARRSVQLRSSRPPVIEPRDDAHRPDRGGVRRRLVYGVSDRNSGGAPDDACCRTSRRSSPGARVITSDRRSRVTCCIFEITLEEFERLRWRPLHAWIQMSVAA